MKMALRMGGREWAMLVTLSVLWGGSFFFVEVALDSFRPFTIVLGRAGLAAVFLWGLIAMTGGRARASPRVWGAFLVMGAINGAVPYTLIVVGQQHITGGLASILNATTPLFTVVLAHGLTRDERMTMGSFAGVLLGLAGVAVLVGPAVLTGFEDSGLGVAGLGQLAVLGAALSYGLAGIYGRRFRDLPPLTAAAGQVTGTALLVLPLALVLETPWTTQPNLPALGAIAGIALLSTALAYVLYFRILAAAGAVNLLLVTFLIPPSALFLGVVFLGERVDAQALGGLALILAGIVAVDGRLARRLFAGKRPQPQKPL